MPCQPCRTYQPYQSDQVDPSEHAAAGPAGLVAGSAGAPVGLAAAQPVALAAQPVAPAGPARAPASTTGALSTAGGAVDATFAAAAEPFAERTLGTRRVAAFTTGLSSPDAASAAGAATSALVAAPFVAAEPFAAGNTACSTDSAAGLASTAVCASAASAALRVRARVGCGWGAGRSLWRIGVFCIAGLQIQCLPYLIVWLNGWVVCVLLMRCGASDDLPRARRGLRGRLRAIHVAFERQRGLVVVKRHGRLFTGAKDARGG